MYRPDDSYTVRTRKVREQSLFGGGLRRPCRPLWPRWRRRCSGGLSIRLGRRIPFGLGHRCFVGYLYAHEQSQRESVGCGFLSLTAAAGAGLSAGCGRSSEFSASSLTVSSLTAFDSGSGSGASCTFTSRVRERVLDAAFWVLPQNRVGVP